ncbi:conserved hypothetical protein [Truepera radiovictrix DSM 17093]|uniref:Uncharacterized protein n=2 Tax=Truepera TaxID=332248 RepID=D7CSA6_TRURR|nr:conserved hypothetical protein [Truepera radiovictrix DSM 17093]
MRRVAVVGTKLWRLFKRTLRRIATRDVLWGTNEETFRQAFLRRKSLLLCKTHWRGRRRYEAHFATLLPHVRLLRLFEPAEAERLLKGLR